MSEDGAPGVAERTAPAAAGAVSPRPRALADFGGEDGLHPAERTLLHRCRVGREARVGDLAGIDEAAPLPPPPGGWCWPRRRTPDNVVRASFLRFLLLGGDAAAPVDERGVLLTGAWIEGELNLYGVKAERQMELKRCRLESVDLQWSSLQAMEFAGCLIANGLAGDGLRCEGGLFLRQGTRVRGGARLLAARIAGGLYCEGGRFLNPAGDALSLDEATITGRLGFDPAPAAPAAGRSMRFLAVGRISLVGTSIGGNLAAMDARLVRGGRIAPDQGGLTALDAAGIKVSGSVSLAGAAAVGDVRLDGCSIGGDLACAGARLTRASADGWALSCSGGAIGRGVQLRDAEVRGGISLSGTTVGNSLDCTGGRFTAPAGQTALYLERCEVAREFVFREVAELAGRVDLSRMHVGMLKDDMASWLGVKDMLELDGLRYDRFDDPRGPDGGGGGPSVDDRIAWLKLQSAWLTRFRPQPWDQLAATLKAIGRPDAARKVLIAEQWAQHEATRLRKPTSRLDAGRRRWMRFYGRTVSFGYEPDWLIAYLLAALIFFWLVYTAATLDCAGAHCPTPAVARLAAKAAVPAVPDTTGFSPFLYALDTLVPADLGYSAEWRPTDSALGWVVRIAMMAETLLSWLFVGIALAVLGRRMARD